MNPAPPIDATKLDELIDLFGDRDEVRDLFAEFFAELPDRLAALRSGLADASTDQVNQAAHALKGSSASLGATRVQEAASALERAARAAELSAAPDDLSRLEQELDALRAWLQAQGLLG